MNCTYCNVIFTPRSTRGKPQKYCSNKCLRDYFYYKNKKPSTRKHWKDLFWLKVRVLPNGCWGWIGWKDRDGYGKFGHTNEWSISYRECGEISTHRISWVIENGPIPEGIGVLHRCDNPPCVKPSHLFLGTNADNVKDKIGKGRDFYAKGEECPRASLKSDDVILMRELWLSGEWSQTDLGLAFGIQQSSVGGIVRGESWKHLL